MPLSFKSSGLLNLNLRRIQIARAPRYPAEVNVPVNALWREITSYWIGYQLFLDGKQFYEWEHQHTIKNN